MRSETKEQADPEKHSGEETKRKPHKGTRAARDTEKKDSGLSSTRKRYG